VFRQRRQKRRAGRLKLCALSVKQKGCRRHSQKNKRNVTSKRMFHVEHLKKHFGTATTMFYEEQKNSHSVSEKSFPLANYQAKCHQS